VVTGADSDSGVAVAVVPPVFCGIAGTVSVQCSCMDAAPLVGHSGGIVGSSS